VAQEHRDQRFKRVLIVFNRSPALPRASVPGAIAIPTRFGQLASLLSGAGHEAFLEPADSIESLSAAVAAILPDIVFSAADHLPAELSAEGESAPASFRPVNVHAWLEASGIPYVGSRPEVIDLALSKAALKTRWVGAGVLTPDFVAVNMRDGPAAFAALATAPLPCIVKPTDAGNSRGIGKDSVAFDRAGLNALATRVGEAFPALIVERYLGQFPDFREFTCACVGNGSSRRLFPAEIVFAKPTERRIVTTEDKNGLVAQAMPIEDGRLAALVTTLAGEAFEAAGVQDYSRCDLIYADGRLWAIEVNGQPMIPDTWFGGCAAFAGLSESDYINAIFDAAIDRLGQEREAHNVRHN